MVSAGERVQSEVTWALYILTAGLAYVVGRAIRKAHRDFDADMHQLNEKHRKTMFKHAVEKLDIYDESIRYRPPKLVRPRGAGESPWAYANYVANVGALGIPPSEPDWRYEESVQLTIRTEVWTTVSDGVLHRVGKVQHSGGTTPVFLCCPTIEVLTPIDVYETSVCPPLTCIECIVKVGAQ